MLTLSESLYQAMNTTTINESLAGDTQKLLSIIKRKKFSIHDFAIACFETRSVDRTPEQTLMYKWYLDMKEARLMSRSDTSNDYCDSKGWVAPDEAIIGFPVLDPNDVIKDMDKGTAGSYSEAWWMDDTFNHGLLFLIPKRDPKMAQLIRQIADLLHANK